MNSDFYKQVAKSNASTNCRNHIKKWVMEQPELITELVEMAINISAKNHYKAVWIVEMIAETDTQLLTPFATTLIDSFPKCKHESAIRGMSRVAYFLATSKVICLSEELKEKIIETCLDWLIGDAKVAPKAYAMYTLCHYSKSHDWIKDELKNIIEKDFAHQSAGYKAAAKEVLRKISN